MLPITLEKDFVDKSKSRNDIIEFSSRLDEYDSLHKEIKLIMLNPISDCENVNVSSLLDRICVSRPYFAFRNIYHYNDILFSKIDPEQLLLDFESTQINSAESSRHMAIFGSCIVSESALGSKKYYLATEARMRKGADISKAISHPVLRSEVFIFAKTIFNNSKNACAITSIADGAGNIIFDLTIEYQIFEPKTFNRIFKNHRKEFHSLNYKNPYRDNIPKLYDYKYSSNCLIARLPKIEPGKCAGHFDNFPMLPVGVMSYICTEAIGEFLPKIVGNRNSKYHLYSARLEVNQPTLIDEESRFILIYNGRKEEIFSFSWIITDFNNSIVYNTMSIDYEISKFL